MQKIAALRANSLGDFIFALPALAALKATYPQAELVLLARQWHQRFLQGRPSCVDRVVVLPPIKGVSLPDTQQYSGFDAPADFIERMRSERFDLAVQLHGGGYYSNPFISTFGAAQTIGMRAEGAPPLDRWIRYVYYQSEVLRFLEVVSLVGASPPQFGPDVAVTDADYDELRSIGAMPSKPFAVLHPGATDPRRRWPVDRYAQLADRLHDAGLQIVLTGDPSERELADDLQRRAHVAAHNLAGALSLGALAALLQSARVVVGNDTGPLHLARAVGAPTITIYWLGNVINAAPLFRHHNRSLISWLVECPVCGQPQTYQRCTHNPSFLTGVSVEEATAQVMDVLSLDAG